MKIKATGGNPKNIETAFKQATAIYVMQMVAAITVFFGAGVGMFLATIWGYWALALISALVLALSTCKLLGI